MSAPHGTHLRPITIDGFKAGPEIQAGPAPMLQWIAIADLVIDDTYQRMIDGAGRRAIMRIAAAFSWARFSAVHVAPVEGGRFAVIDGQHRTHAAALCGFESVPCQVVTIAPAEQAAAFAAINGIVKPILPVDIYKAALAAGEEWAVTADRAVRDAGCQLMTYGTSAGQKKPGQVFATKTIRRSIEDHGAEATTAALRAIRQAPHHGATVDAYNVAMLRPAINAIASRPRLHAKIGTWLDTFDIASAAEQAKDYVRDRRRRGVPSVSAVEYLEALIGDALDRSFPVRVAPGLPSAGEGPQ
ncbi:hypothetical protein ATO13_08686 [Stappia sp. 22II-S9-Z10]|nr:hypothetical protein ATO13_08686 [Stappia sp. 22II-S9-Z10]